MGELNKAFKYVFGPVPSRRLGRSLGVDLVPRKACSFDCVYCQVGRTTRKTTRLEEFAPPEEIVAEIAEKLKTVPRPNYITLSGSGEPTLHAGIGRIIAGVKEVTDVPVAVLTNGSLFWKPEVRRACLKADLILPTLDAGDEETFRAICRPAPDLTLERVVEGLAALRKEYRGQIWLEVFLIAGVNSGPEQVRNIRALAERINPDRIQLNTAVRPTAEPDVKALTETELAEIARLMGPKAEVIADFRKREEEPAFIAKGDEILAMIRRRPVTLDDIASGLGIARPEAERTVKELLAKKLIVGEKKGEKEYLRAT